MSTPPRPTLPLLREGETCWRRARAERLAWLIDGEAFFGALGHALLQAREQVLLVGWDFHSRMRLWRGDTPKGVPVRFLDLLEHCVRRRSSLQVHALCWNYSTLFTLEREPLPRLRFSALTHHRIHFRLDGAHPPLGSQHQKLVVVDDALAFVGGFDVTQNRWDRRAHAPGDTDRCDPSGVPYAPFHDVQVMVSGPAAACVGELARDRWRFATEETLEPPEIEANAWLDPVEVAATDVDIALARTLPEHGERPAVNEVERLYVEMIGRARRWIYIENQYLTSHRIGAALQDRLREADGPEVVIVGPEQASGWLEQATMDVLRRRLCADLIEADHAGRLRLLRPFVPGLEETLNVHAKVMIVDDRVARVGSSNLSNRSMGLDSECDLVVDAEDQPNAIDGVRRLLNDLLSEHLDTRPEKVAKSLERTGSLIQTIEELSDSPRRLVPLELSELDDATELVTTGLSMADPEAPASLETLRALYPMSADDEETMARRVPIRRIAVALTLVVGLVAIWRFTPLTETLDPQALERLAAPLRSAPLAPLIGFVGFVVLVHLLFPVTVLIAASALLFGGWQGFAVAWLGTGVSAFLGHRLGDTWLRDVVESNAGRWIHRLGRSAARRGILASAIIRLLPIAPFQVVNLIVGASPIRLRDFLIGSQLALTPGIAATALASDSIWRAILQPSTENLMTALGLLGVAVAIAIGLGAWAKHQEEDTSS